ncbi:MAG: hypothetical protein JWQ75_4096 [Pseudarthrobacter sp.]|nr:hypothetical protein [Pseudarthrobacter sp.]
MKNLSAADVEHLLSADPAAKITESELARSRARSLSFRESDATQIFAGGPVGDHSRVPAKRRRRVAGAFLAAAAVAAGVLTATTLQPPAVEVPAATATSPATGTTPVPTAAADPGQIPPTGPLHDLFVSAEEVLVLEALPNPARNLSAGLGVEPVNVRQALKGSRTLGETTVDVAAADDSVSGTLLWRDSQKEAPFTYLGFFSRTADGGLHVLDDAHALLQIQNIRTAAAVDPVTAEPVDIGDDLQARIDVAPRGDVPLATYAAGLPAEQATDVIVGTEGEGGMRAGVVRGYVSAAEACFTFENAAEKVYLRWPAGFTAAVRSLLVDAEGHVSYFGTVQAETPVVLNEWGFIAMAHLDPRPLVEGHLSDESDSCNGERLPVLDVAPAREGGSPFQKGRGVALPTP